jgi:hypothetical protein
MSELDDIKWLALWFIIINRCLAQGGREECEEKVKLER